MKKTQIKIILLDEIITYEKFEVIFKFIVPDFEYFNIYEHFLKYQERLKFITTRRISLGYLLNISFTSKFERIYWKERGLSKKEIDDKIKSLKKENSIRCKKHWIKKGFSEEDAINKVSEIQKDRGDKGVKSKQNNPDYFEIWQIGYWLKKGFSEEESKLILKERKLHYN